MIVGIIKKINLDKFLYLGMGLIIGLVIGSVLYGQANAEEPMTKHIVIEWSEACLILIDLGDLETCGNPELIKSIYPPPAIKPGFQKMFDDSAKTDSTKYKINNVLLNHKKSCVLENYCNVFDNYSNIYYWYDPDQSISGYYDKRITINTHMKHKNLNVQNDEIFVNDTSRSLILDTNQINIKYCRDVSYSPEAYRMIREMGGIMWYILYDCDDFSKLGVLSDPYVEIHNKTDYSPLDSPEWKNLQELEALKTKYKENMLGKD